VARIYAGVLGLLAFLTCLARGALQGGGPDTILGTACLALAAFTVLGQVIGACAAWIVEDAVRGRLAAEVAADAGTDHEKDFVQPVQ
jgi:hypothetical protein